MSTPPYTGNGGPVPPPGGNGGGGKSAGRPPKANPSAGHQGGANGGGPGNSYHFTYNRTRNGGGWGGQAAPGAGPGYGAGPGFGGGQQGGPVGSAGGAGAGAGRGPSYSPLGDPDFFTNADVRAFCERGRSALMQICFELAMAHEILNAVLKEVPDADGRPFGAQARARRVSKHFKKAADDAKDCAAEIARTYASFQKEFDPEISRVARPRQAPRRPFDFGG
ncbi:plasmid transfer protein TraA [Kitasatospora sp. NPDC093806]|uniref:plasmid transfer protein TraA n=1 Tax=Kitasatospora sp. NPDC093806 TaxID=3155075 RepID=UPI00342106F7